MAVASNDTAAVVRSAEFRLKWLEREVEILEDKIKFYDDLSFRIKSWAVGTWSAIVSFAITRGDWRLSALASVTPLLFLIVDASYKRYQVSFIRRTRDIMALLNDPRILMEGAGENRYGPPIYDLLGIYGRGRTETDLDRRWGSMLRLTTKASVGLLYWVLIAIGVLVTLHLTTNGTPD